MQRVRVWDLPTRVFHWALALSVVGLVVSANLGGNWMNLHIRLGYVVFTLLLFRLGWGLIGGYWSRFSQFLYPPRDLLRYLRGQGSHLHQVGHSPLGALAVFAFLLVLAAQVGSGLFTDDEIAFFGPLVTLVSGDVVSLASDYHRKVGKLILIVLVIMHVAALLYYKWVKRQPLVAAMLHGDKTLSQNAPSSRDGLRQRLLALAWLACSAAVVWWVVGLGAA